MVQPVKPLLDYNGLVRSWDEGDAATRRDLLGKLFDGLDLDGDAVAAFLPRSDRFDQVNDPMDRMVMAEREGFRLAIY